MKPADSRYRTLVLRAAAMFLLGCAEMALAEFNSRMEQFIAEIKSVPLAKGYDEVYYPGEIEARNDARNREHGLQFPPDTLADLIRIAKETGLESKLPVPAVSGAA